MGIFIVVAAYLFAQMIAVWLYYVKCKNPIVVDVAWVLGLAVSGFIYLFAGRSSISSWVFGILLLTWALRLGRHLLLRLAHNTHDARYQKLSDQWKMAKSLGFFLNFELQAILIYIIVLPFYFIGHKVAPFSALDIVAAVIVIVGIVGESVADFQLSQFANKCKGDVCNIGLWKYSRHPNYFCEWLIWSGFAVVALGHLWGWIALISPLCLYLIMDRITIPLTEECSLEKRGAAYRNYMNATPKFFPQFKR